ncbi:Uncharacterised protein [Escherichia coli]|uniref:Uncharacterized protein n=1 Tax=Escherichia coli TaxID=562 RepID=A0A376MWC4_ECOLX|nr:Uncharacterised protein [Escherichia coli]
MPPLSRLSALFSSCCSGAACATTGSGTFHQFCAWSWRFLNNWFGSDSFFNHRCDYRFFGYALLVTHFLIELTLFTTRLNWTYTFFLFGFLNRLLFNISAPSLLVAPDVYHRYGGGYVHDAAACCRRWYVLFPLLSLLTALTRLGSLLLCLATITTVFFAIIAAFSTFTTVSRRSLRSRRLF